MKLRLVFLLFSFKLTAQIGTGEWRLHVPNKKAIDIAANRQLVYTAFENGLLEYDMESNETRLLTVVNGLSDINLTCLHYHNAQNAFFVGYENGNLDKIVDGKVTNIPAIRLAEIIGNKRINKIVPHQGYLYLATGFSIVKIDPIKDEVKETYYPTKEGAGILDIAFRGDSVFAMTSNRLLRANLNNPAIVDPSQWVVDTRVKVLNANAYKDVEIIDNELFVLFKSDAYGLDSVFHITNNGKINVYKESFSLEIQSIGTYENKLVIHSEGGIYHYHLNLTYDKVFLSYNLGTWLIPQNSVTLNGKTWVADAQKGLLVLNNEYSLSAISFQGPPKNRFYSMDWLNGKLVVASGGLSGISCTFNNAGIYVFEEEQWRLSDEKNMPLWPEKKIWDFLSVSIDPTDNQTVAVGTYSEIPVSIMRSGEQVTDTFTQSNSTLKNALGGPWCLVSNLKFDQSGNLWVLNAYSDRPLNVYTKEKKWLSFECGMQAKNKFSGKMVIDYKGNKWFALDNTGLFGYNDNQTVADPTDDKQVYLNTGEFSGNLPSDRVTALAVDFDNELWIGTDNGFAVLYNAESAFNASLGDYNASRLKVEFEGNVEYVLGNTSITDIEIDGGNRKWIGTANSGIVLLSSDGSEIIQQFTTENSPLISNTILDMAFDHHSGELFIATDRGLISYRADASYGDPDYSEVKVFPNPVRPGFDGLITIQGIQYNSDVKVTDVAGNLIYKTTSNGGTATWNGKTLSGERVPAGVYLLWTAAIEGKGRKVGKVLVLN